MSRHKHKQVDQQAAIREAEARIHAAARKAGDTWKWAPYSRPRTGGPYMWNDIIVNLHDGGSRIVQALVYCEEVEQTD